MGLPTSLFSLALFVVLLLPGFAYLAVRGRTGPERPMSPLRETITVVSVSLVALAAVLALAGLARVLAPGHTPSIGELLKHPHEYALRHYVTLTWWAVGLLALAIVGSAGAAWLRSAAPGRPPHPSQMSSWWLAFTEYPADTFDIHVGCTLENGSYVTGVVYAYPQTIVDSADRDLVLRPPIAVRPAGAAQPTPLANVGLMTVSARRIVTMTVGYVPREAPDAKQSG
ncbi:DUF6338 family protein [Micromonospora sp. NPDC048839]|uniref:DUF6338 family protein n=1 Tax=Micromonospora sp. NPDC048839 TaxID=3155641 RepID=UPI0033C19DFE